MASHISWHAVIIHAGHRGDLIKPRESQNILSAAFSQCSPLSHPKETLVLNSDESFVLQNMEDPCLDQLQLGWRVDKGDLSLL